jgi:hypothetical protein
MSDDRHVASLDSDDDVERCAAVYEHQLVDGRDVLTVRRGRLWRPAEPLNQASGNSEVPEEVASPSPPSNQRKPQRPPKDCLSPIGKDERSKL